MSMYKSVAIVALVVSASASGQQPQAGDRDPIEVYVANGRIDVPEEVAEANNGHRAIIWRLRTGGHTFQDQGIVFDGAGANYFRCGAFANGRMVRCMRNGYQPGVKYKYTVLVNGLEPLDPWIKNR